EVTIVRNWWAAATRSPVGTEHEPVIRYDGDPPGALGHALGHAADTAIHQADHGGARVPRGRPGWIGVLPGNDPDLRGLRIVPPIPGRREQRGPVPRPPVATRPRPEVADRPSGGVALGKADGVRRPVRDVPDVVRRDPVVSAEPRGR